MNDKRLLKKMRAMYGESENHYILRLYIREAIKDQSGITPRLYAAVKEILTSHSLRLSAEELTDSISYENRVKAFLEEEILALDRAVSLVLLRELTACREKDKEKRLRLAENAAYTLRSLEASDFEERYLKLSALENTLRKTDPIYPLCDKATQDDIKGRIIRFAKKHRLSETAAASLFAEQQEKKEPSRKKGFLFLITLYVISLGITLSLLFFKIPYLLLPLLFFVIFELVRGAAESLLRRFLPAHPIPKLKLETIPDNAKTLVVITTLLTKEEKEPFDKIERFYLANKDNNIRFGLLFDLADAKSATTERDACLAAYAEEQITRLNEKYQNAFFLALRQRSYSRSEKRYIGQERKRGAIIDLVRYIYDEGDAFSLILGDTDFVRNAAYLITLDADTNLYIGAVKEMVGAMLHPENRPVIEKGAVRKGYGILQPRMAVTVESACASRFSLLICGSGGIDPYASAAFDIYQNLFGKGIFCGKGILDISAFHALIPNAFEKEKILSHDLLEGNLLRAGFLSDVVLTDSFPQNPLSYFSRMHRWYRGDVQALPYAFESPRDAFGKRYKNPTDALGRYQLLDNLRRLLTPALTLFALLFSLFFGARTELAVSLTVAVCLLLPLLFSLFQKGHGLFRRYYSLILPSFAYRFMNAVFTISSLAHHSLLALDALCRSLFRMLISKRHLLLWTTAARAEEKKSSALSYLTSTLPGMLIGIVTLTFAQSAPLRLFAVSWIVFPLFLVLLAHRFAKRPKALSAHAKAQLSRYVFDMWGYFEKFVTEEENYLPPDNVQQAPVRAIAHRTSPTNIGMYLLSCLAARDFGYIDSQELLKRTGNTLATLEKMPKKYGHLYNWYDTRTLSLLGAPFISTVDSGNLIVSLLTLTNGLKEYAEEEPALRRVIYRYEKLIEETDFSALYCEKRNLFYVSRDNEEPSPLSCYDLYMSEARTTSYYAVACGIVPKKHWEKLSRIVVGQGRYTGLASWSGTTFEYFMPHLFLPILPSSLSDEALSFCVSCQKKERENGLYGISESAYYAFDADMNYQYRAHGNETLALDAHAGKSHVISPYSSFLMLAKAPNASLANLERLKLFGAYGEYGFYEAIDFAPSATGKDHAIIKSFMSHHVGMSILASANACFDNRFVNRFMRDPRMAAAKELLEERIPTDAPLFDGKLLNKESERERRLSFPFEEKKLRTEKKSDRLPKIVLLSNQSAYLKLASTGEVELALNKIALTYPALAPGKKEALLSSLRVVFSHNETASAALPDLFSYSGTRAVFTTVREKLTVKTTFTLHGEKNLFGVSVSASGVTGKFTPTLVFEPILTTTDAFFAHPFYRALSIEAFFSRDEEILCFRCRRREDESEKWLAVFCEGDGALAFDSRKDILPFGYEEEDILALSQKPLSCRTGAVLSPLAVMRREVSPRLGKASVEFLIAVGASRAEAEEAIRSTRKKGSSLAEILSESLRPTVRRMLRSLGEDRPDLKYAELYLSSLVFPEKSGVTLSQTESITTLWRASISGDYPIIAIVPPEEETDGTRRIQSIFIKLHRLMREKGVFSDLVFLCQESDSYNRPIASRVGRQIAEEGQNGYVGKRGGIFFVSDPDVARVAAALSCLYLPLDKNSSPEEIYYRITGRKRPLETLPITKPEPQGDTTVPTGALRVQGGYFHKNSFTVIKSEVDSPRSFVYASSSFGTLVSASSPGFTWLTNAKECRLTPPSDNLFRDITDERVLGEKNGKLYDLAAMSHTVEYAEGAAIYCGTLEGEPYSVKIGVDRSLPVKLILAELPKGIKLTYTVRPTFGARAEHRQVVASHREGETLFYENRLSLHLADQRIFLSPIAPSEGETKQGYLFGIYPIESEERYHEIRSKYHSTDAIEAGFLEYAAHYRGLFSALQFHLPRPELEVMLNRFIPYQAYVIRMLARTGYHQSGGAFGFRDQLQDALAMLYYDSGIMKRQILRACAHQYKEGDVQHWWHPFRSPDDMGAGIRTRITDDMLWLPYAVAKYLGVTGDTELLETEVSYLDSPPLAPEENDRYECPVPTAHKESVYRHCMRAIEASLDLSERGLPHIGGGDWNDAFNRVGVLGKGESIFLARFMQIVFKDFAKVSEKVGDTASRDLLQKRAQALADAVEEHAWEDDRYLRGSYDSGAPLGSRHSRECKIDSLSQSFSALAEGENDRTAEAMANAYRLLYDSEHKLFKLFDPPFSADKKEAGYISAYCEGFRENGGQYNHGALFAARGFFAVGEKRKGYEILEAVNACARSLNPKSAKAYRSEPYALCGDIYTNPEHLGRGGWSLYTGAAGWFLTTVLECLIGYHEEEDHFTLSPALSEKLPNFSMKLSRKNTVYHISVALAEKEKTLLDGKKSENRFFFDGGHHILEMDIEKKEKL